MTQNAETARAESGPFQENLAGGEAAAIVAQIRRRRHAALRCAPLPCGHRDPLDCLAANCGGSAPADEAAPPAGTFGLKSDELRAEANRLVLREGWQLWEVMARLDIAPLMQHCPCCSHARKADA